MRKTIRAFAGAAVVALATAACDTQPADDPATTPGAAPAPATEPAPMPPPPPPPTMDTMQDTMRMDTLGVPPTTGG
ncbi:MAG TPA: hypothetical protein VK929_15750 [Longimicrobiales bacterium]|nr:hypothetical protein [Longimicrobiales bacterium]